MAHAQKPDFVFRRNGRVHLNRRGCQFSLLLAAEVCASAVVMLDTPSSELVWRVLATHSIRQFPLQFPSPCVTVCHYISTGVYNCRSQWPGVLRRESAVANLLRMSVRIPPRVWMSVSCEWFLLSDRGLCVGLITRPKESYRVSVCLSVIVKPR